MSNSIVSSDLDFGLTSAVVRDIISSSVRPRNRLTVPIQTLKPFATEVENDMRLFKVLQTTVDDYITQNATSLAHKM